MDRRQVWRAVLGELEISLSQATFETWFRRTALLRVDEASSTFVLGVASGFAKDWIEERYRSLIAQTIAKIVGYSVTLTVEVVSEAELDERGALSARSKGVAAASSVGADQGGAAGSAASHGGDAVRIVTTSDADALGFAPLPEHPAAMRVRAAPSATRVVSRARRMRCCMPRA